MKVLKIELEHCYGIRSLKRTIDFSTTKAIAIYAPNGSMKSSFAQTFEDIASGNSSKDRIFPSRASKRVIQDEHDADLPKENILVVRPYEETFGQSTKTSTLLVNATLRSEYESLHIEIDAAKSAFLKAMKEQSGSKRDLEKEISLAFTPNDDKFYIALHRIKGEVTSRPDAPLRDIPYDLIFDERVQGFLGTKDFKTAIEAYIRKYNELIAASTYFKKGVFNYYNAAQIARQLADNGFFAANHSVNLNSGEKNEITSQKELEDLIAKEKSAISNDTELRKKFSEIEKLIQKNTTVREFEAYLLGHENLLHKLGNMAELKQEIWKAYIDTRFDLYQTLLEKYQAAEARRKEIQEQAVRERTQWEEVIDIFNNRFVVPFKLEAVNKVDVILGQEDILSLGFVFSDGEDHATVDRASLLQVLSTGEKKALYVLNILFEIEVRKASGQETLIIVDDIADSFDYKNKYAIIQYLMDISECQHFRQIILTHNFDFFRTVESRFVSYKNCLMVSKTGSGVALQQAIGTKNIFVNDWKAAFYTDPKKKIASISFIRNLIEYTRGELDPDFLKLTSLLHWKADSHLITVLELDDIYNRLFSASSQSQDGQELVINVVDREANSCLNAPDGINFENKVVLAIATRLAAEQFMVSKINDANFVSGITSNQTSKLLKRFQQLHPADQPSLVILHKVVLMTPENIHLNSFMYEPILDMSDNHLRKLFTESRSLLNSSVQLP